MTYVISLGNNCSISFSKTSNHLFFGVVGGDIQHSGCETRGHCAFSKIQWDALMVMLLQALLK